MTKPPDNWPEIFYHNLEQAIEFHKHNENDPYGIGNAVILSLSETRDALGFAMKGEYLPKPVVKK